MTGDGAVVREWVWNDYQMNPQAVQHISAGGKQLWGPATVSEHNAAIRQQAAEIERLTGDLKSALSREKTMTETAMVIAARAEASEARIRVLLTPIPEQTEHGYTLSIMDKLLNAPEGSSGAKLATIIAQWGIAVDGRKASDARAADLLKALERYGEHKHGCPLALDDDGNYIASDEWLAGRSRECDCGLAAAKGGTV